MTQDASLQSQIDQLIAPSGEAPSAAEVQNARIGADGVTYDTLGNAIRTQFTHLENGIEFLKSQNIFVEVSNILKGYYNASLVFTEAPDSAWTIYIINVSVGDHFLAKLNSAYTTIPKIIEFDSNGNATKGITSSPAAGEIEYVVNDSSVKKIGFQTYKSGNLEQVDDIYIKKLNADEKSVVYKDNATNPTVVQNEWFYTYNRQFNSRDGINHYDVTCEAGDVFDVLGARVTFNEAADGMIVFFNGTTPLVRIEGTALTVFEAVVTAPTGATKMIVQSEGNYVPSITKRTFSFDVSEYEYSETTSKKLKKARFLYNSTLGWTYRYKYSSLLDCAYRFNYKGVNNNFGINNIAHLSNTDKYVKDTFNDFSDANNFYTLSSEWLSPYAVKAIHNIDGDYSSGLTGGSHTLGDNIATMNNESLTVYLDGIETTIESNKIYYCDTVGFKVVNLIQACNTVKNNGNGRAVIRETQFIKVNEGSIDYDVKIEFLEDVTVDVYYGMQEEMFRWGGSMSFVGDPNHLQIMSAMTDINGSNKSQGIANGWFLMDSTGHEFATGNLDTSYGLGKREFLGDLTPTIITRAYGKFYTWLISNHSFNENEAVFYRCKYSFFNK